MMYYIYNPQPMSLPSFNYLHLTATEKAETRFYRSRSLKQRSNQGQHDVAHLQLPTNVPTMHQFSTPYGFQDIGQTRFYRSRSLQQGQR